MDVAVQSKFAVGGVLLDQPFKIRRLGHVGLNLHRQAEGLHFYKDLLGFKITDIGDPTAGGTKPVPQEWKEFGDLKSYFFRYGSDHHAFVLINHRLRRATDMRGRFKEGVTVGQMSWQVGSLAEVKEAHRWLAERREPVIRSGRDMPGSNWHTYLMDPDWHQNEIFYGMEQIGWDGRSKPRVMEYRDCDSLPLLPQIPEQAEVDEARLRGIDLESGFRDEEILPLTYDVQAVLMARPFKIVKHGPVSLFVEDVDRSEAWYRNVLGFIRTEEVDYRGHRCVFLRNNTEHHSLALFPVALRAVLGLRADTSLASLGLQLASYQQLRDAIAFLRGHGVTLRELPPELTPGMNHTILAFDPDGHALQLYWAMEQIGWDGKPRPADRRTGVGRGWPAQLEANSDSYAGEPFLGPFA